MSAAIEQRNQDATAYCGGLDERVTEELLWELMLQAGPVVNVHIPRDKVSDCVELSLYYHLSMLPIAFLSLHGSRVLPLHEESVSFIRGWSMLVGVVKPFKS